MIGDREKKPADRRKRRVTEEKTWRPDGKLDCTRQAGYPEIETALDLALLAFAELIAGGDRFAPGEVDLEHLLAFGVRAGLVL